MMKVEISKNTKGSNCIKQSKKTTNIFHSKFYWAAKDNVKTKTSTNRLKRKADILLSIASEIKKKKEINLMKEKTLENGLGKDDKSKYKQDDKYGELKPSEVKLKDDIKILKKSIKKKKQKTNKSELTKAKKNRKTYKSGKSKMAFQPTKQKKKIKLCCFKF